jgi:acetoin utilization protein AcuB
MNLFSLVSSIMTPADKLVTVNPEDTLMEVKKIFDTHSFHHLPVVRFRSIVGIISKTDFNHFTGGLSLHTEDRFVNDAKLENTKAQDIMTKGMGKVEPDDRINVALEVFSRNWFHALPVVQNDELVGILTTQDIIRAILDEKPLEPHMVYENKE